MNQRIITGSLYGRQQTCFMDMETLLSKQPEIAGAVQPGEEKAAGKLHCGLPETSPQHKVGDGQ